MNNSTTQPVHRRAGDLTVKDVGKVIEIRTGSSLCSGTLVNFVHITPPAGPRQTQIEIDTFVGLILLDQEQLVGVHPDLASLVANGVPGLVDDDEPYDFEFPVRKGNLPTRGPGRLHYSTPQAPPAMTPLEAVDATPVVPVPFAPEVGPRSYEDRLMDIEHRIVDCSTYKFGTVNADRLAHQDAVWLLCEVRRMRRMAASILGGAQ